MQFFQHDIKVGDACVPLRAYIPDGAPHGFFQGNRPAMIVFPGGGYGITYGGEAEPIALAYVAAGFCAFVLDYDHNAYEEGQLQATHLPFYKTIREKNPDIPIIMVSRPDFDSNPQDNKQRVETIYKTYEYAKNHGDNKSCPHCP